MRREVGSSCMQWSPRRVVAPASWWPTPGAGAALGEHRAGGHGASTLDEALRDRQAADENGRPSPSHSAARPDAGRAALLLLTRVVGRVHEAEIARPHAVHLHDRLLVAGPGVVRMVRRDRRE